jgi:hypothetical protein
MVVPHPGDFIPADGYVARLYFAVKDIDYSGVGQEQVGGKLSLGY